MRFFSLTFRACPPSSCAQNRTPIIEVRTDVGSHFPGMLGTFSFLSSQSRSRDFEVSLVAILTAGRDVRIHPKTAPGLRSRVYGAYIERHVILTARRCGLTAVRTARVQTLQAVASLHANLVSAQAQCSHLVGANAGLWLEAIQANPMPCGCHVTFARGRNDTDGA